MEYELHCLRYGVLTERIALTCASDAEALKVSGTMCASRDHQLWQGERLVANIVSKGVTPRAAGLPKCCP